MRKLILLTLICLAVMMPCAVLAEAASSGSGAPVISDPVPLIEFLGWEDYDLQNAAVQCSENDCEEGPIPVEITEEDREEILEFISENLVTGKENDLSVTGGTISWIFLDAGGNYLCSLELYDGLLVMNDGMYRLAPMEENADQDV